VPDRPPMPMSPALRGSLRRRLRRVRGELWPIAQTTLAAGAAWALASLVHSRPFFAPVSAVISLGVARGRRTVRAIELTVGVAVGITVADLIVAALGGGTLVIMLVVALSMAAALLVGGGVLLVNQAAISAILVVATLQPGAGPSPGRFVDALIGGGIALLVGQVLFPRDPLKAMAKAARPVVSDLAVALSATAEGLRENDPSRARRSSCVARGGAPASACRFTPTPRSRSTTPCATRGYWRGACSARSVAARARRPSWPTRSRFWAMRCSSSATSSRTPIVTPGPAALRSRQR
jgi:uncharacterized membrane protein YccC